MKTKKTQSIIFQILIILSINYLILIAEGFIFKTQWKPNFIFALAFFHFGTFSSLYATFISKILLKEKIVILIYLLLQLILLLVTEIIN
jgi:hypothetical protein